MFSVRGLGVLLNRGVWDRALFLLVTGNHIMNVNNIREQTLSVDQRNGPLIVNPIRQILLTCHTFAQLIYDSQHTCYISSHHKRPPLHNRAKTTLALSFPICFPKNQPKSCGFVCNALSRSVHFLPGPGKPAAFSYELRSIKSGLLGYSVPFFSATWHSTTPQKDNPETNEDDGPCLRSLRRATGLQSLQASYVGGPDLGASIFRSPFRSP